jgi:2'-5' RNA ligase
LSSRNIYDSIYDKNIADIKSGNIKLDEYLSGNKPDSRIGISLIIPIRSISKSHEKLVSCLKEIEPEQYYYPTHDLHITIFDYIQGTENYIRNPELEKLFIRVSRESLKSFHEFLITFEGIVFSKAAGIIQGYDDNVLIKIREKIRILLKENGIKNDERYESESAHITFMRFMNYFIRAEELCRFINENREREIGIQKIEEIELVEHDWYNHESNKRIIEKIRI